MSVSVLLKWAMMGIFLVSGVELQAAADNEGEEELKEHEVKEEEEKETSEQWAWWNSVISGESSAIKTAYREVIAGNDAARLLLEGKLTADSWERVRAIEAVSRGNIALRWLLGKKFPVDFCDPVFEITMLMMAAGSGNNEMVRILLDAHASIDMQSVEGFTALRCAAGRGRVDIVKLLLDAHARLDLGDMKGFTPLMAAVREGHCAVVELLLHNGRQASLLNVIDSKGETALMIAAKKGYEKIVNVLLAIRVLDVDCIPDIALQNNEGNTALMLALTNGHRAIAQRLIKASRGVTVTEEDGTVETVIDIANRYGYTALLVAAKNDYVDMVNELLYEGACVDRQGTDEGTALEWATITSDVEYSTMTALMWAVYNGSVPMVKTLLAHNADVSVVNDQGETALMIAAHKGHADIVDLLLAAGTGVNKEDNKGRTALMWAAEQGHFQVVQQLLDAQADVNKKSSDGSTALIAAVWRDGKPELLHNVSIVQRLLEAKAHADACIDQDGYTSLMIATHYGYDALVDVLLEAGVNINVQDKKGNTALASLIGENSQERMTMVKKLIFAGAQIDVATEINETINGALVERSAAEQFSVWLDQKEIKEDTGVSLPSTVLGLVDQYATVPHSTCDRARKAKERRNALSFIEEVNTITPKVAVTTEAVESHRESEYEKQEDEDARAQQQ